jgi:hypothetical protein
MGKVEGPSTQAWQAVADRKSFLLAFAQDDGLFKKAHT